MNQGIYYLYEYEKNRRIRNTGFIKITRHYQSCILQIHARGISVGNGAGLELHAFYIEGTENIIASQIASLTCFGRSISIRLSVTENSFPENRSLEEIDGFLIKLPGVRSKTFWAVSAVSFPADLDLLRTPEIPAAEPKVPEETEDDTREAPSTEPAVPEKETPPAQPESDTEEIPADTEAPAGKTPPAEPGASPIETPDEPEASVGETPAEEDSPAIDETSSEEEVPANEEISAEEKIPANAETAAEKEEAEAQEDKVSVRRITRAELSSLPRRFWPLANNSFLLHGYHNYNHLLLVEEDGHIWLGVPGIYDVREARAADLFGFPQFSRTYAPLLELTEEERNDTADFGHWCRYIGLCKNITLK